MLVHVVRPSDPNLMASRWQVDLSCGSLRPAQVLGWGGRSRSPHKLPPRGICHPHPCRVAAAAVDVSLRTWRCDPVRCGLRVAAKLWSVAISASILALVRVLKLPPPRGDLAHDPVPFITPAGACGSGRR